MEDLDTDVCFFFRPRERESERDSEIVFFASERNVYE